MPNTEQEFDWEKIKTDPRIWMRLATPIDDRNVLGNLFDEEENPFEKDGDAAIEKLKALAADGKLYLREYGRARHFNKVELNGDTPKLVGSYKQTLNGNTDPIAGLLMRMSRGYFKWIGWNGISGWFDKRLQSRDERIKQDKQAQAEYNSLSKKEKKELKKRLKQEKLEAKAQKKLDKLEQNLGKDTTKGKGEMDAPLTQPPVLESEQNTLQPTLLGDKPVQEQQTPWKDNLTPERPVSQEILGSKKTEKTIPDFQLAVNGVEYTKDDYNKLPENIKQALDLITAFIAQQKNEITNEVQPVTNENEIKQENPAIDADAPVVGDAEQNLDFTLLQDNPPQQEVNIGQMDAPLNQPADLEPEKVSMQKPLVKQEPTSLQQRLAGEAQAMDAVKNWKDLVANSLLSHEEAKPYRDTYQMLKGQDAVGAEYLSGAVFGILTNTTVSRESKQQVMDALLSGRPLGSEHDALIGQGIGAYNHAVEQMTQGNKGTMAELLANSIRELSRQAGRETELSARNVLLGRLMSNAAAMATEHDLELPMTEDEMSVATGAAIMADLSQRYHEAKQYLGKEPMDMTSRDGRRAVRDFMAGRAVESMIEEDHKFGQEIPNTQLIMGGGMWTLKNLLTMTSDTKTRREIKPEQVKAMLEDPKGFTAASIAQNLAKDLVEEAMEVQKLAEEAKDKELQAEQLLGQPQINPKQVG